MDDDSDRPVDVLCNRPGGSGDRACGGFRGRSLFVLIAVWLVVGNWLGCTADRRYRVMSFFFDGVPDPNATPEQLAAADEDSAGGNVAVKKLAVFVHKPYAENKCDSCHVGSTGQYESFSKLQPTICLNCHQKVISQYPVMHGPVASVECLWCHSPHESSVPGLLKQASPAVCVQCHDRELLPINPPEHQDPDKDCLGCHVAHGGAKHGMIRPGTRFAMEGYAQEAGIAAPTTGPSTTAPSTESAPTSAPADAPTTLPTTIPTEAP